MSKVNYEKLENSLNELKEQYGSYSTLDEQNLSDVNQRAVKNSVIKCFEICYDTLWKQIKKYLQDENGKAELRNSPIPIFRAAFEDLLFNKDVHKRLVQYNKIRNDAAHDYSIEKAMAALDKVGEFVQDTEEIYEVMVKGE